MKVRVTVKDKGGEAQSVAIHTEFIRLQDFLKFCNAVPSGGTAKNIIQGENVKVNGEICTMRGKKLHPGDTVEFDGALWQVAASDNGNS